MQKEEKSNPGGDRLSRRNLCRQMGEMGLWSVFDRWKIFSLIAVQKKQAAPQSSSNATSHSPAPSSGHTPGLSSNLSSDLAPEDDQFLDELEKLNFQYFWEQASPQTGLVKDRSKVLAKDTTVVGSIAA